VSVPIRRATPALLQIESIMSRLGGRQAINEVCRYLTSEFPHYPWVGVYRLAGGELVLEAWPGPEATKHTRIPVDRGICGQAAREGRTVIVDDVSAAPEYLACFLSTRSEIVVPIRYEGRVTGEIDIDGNVVRAFDASDRDFLERVATRLAPAVEASAAEPPLPP
jgi:L-methionine (R)-S-oxide reductase